MKILVTGGAGFIGNHLVRMLLNVGSECVLVLDALTYAGTLDNIADCLNDDRCTFIHGDVADADLVMRTVLENKIDTIYHLAAETHVDRSIVRAHPFVSTNVVGTVNILEAVRRAPWDVRLVHVSTDEVYGALAPDALPFTEDDVLKPSSPYAASKAAADLMVRSYVATYGIDAIVTRCCNNYGPRQYPEKLIPLMTTRAIEGAELPVYGDGQQIREWIYVDDHCRALISVNERGATGQTYNIGTGHEEANLHVVRRIVQLTGASEVQVTHVIDRAAHDRRYALDSTKLLTNCGWQPHTDFEQGLRTTVLWYQQQAKPTAQKG